MLAVRWCLNAIDDGGDLVEIGEIDWNIRADGKPYPMRSHRNALGKIEDRRLQFAAAMDAVIDRDLKHVKMIEVLARPSSDGVTIPNSDRRTCRHAGLVIVVAIHLVGAASNALDNRLNRSHLTVTISDARRDQQTIENVLLLVRRNTAAAFAAFARATRIMLLGWPE